MPITLGANIASLRARTQLDRATAKVSTSYERLSSGLRINKASDDAASLAIAQQLNGKVRVLGQAVRNVSDAVSLMTIADSTLNSLKDIITRNLELATQAANGVYSDRQRTALDNEAASLTAEYNRILSSASFNGALVFGPGGSTISVQNGTSGSDHVEFSVGGNLITVPATISGTPDGTFDAQVSYTTFLGGLDARAGDMNGDGKLDLVTINGYGDVSVLIGNGNGTFQAMRTYTGAGAGLEGGDEMALADFSGDGILDVIVDRHVTPSTWTFAIFQGNSDGSLAAPVMYGPPVGDNRATMFITGDINADGKLDILAPNVAGSDIRAFFGNGNGTFAAPLVYGTTASPQDGSLVDFDGDGKLDLLFATYGGAGGLFLMVGNGDGTFKANTNVASGSNNTKNIVTRDFNNDGKLDVVQTYNAGPGVVYLGNGNGTFNSAQNWGSFGWNTYGHGFSDVDGDGTLDIVSADAISNQLYISIGNGNGSFKTAITLPSVTGHEVRFGDFDGDGISDLIIPSGAPGTGIGIMLANGDSSQATASNTLPTIPISTQSAARSAIGTLTSVLDNLNSESASIGAHLSRLNTQYSSLLQRQTDYSVAYDRIMSADVAEESARLISSQLIQQAGAAILAQANLQPQIALKLLKLS